MYFSNFYSPAVGWEFQVASELRFRIPVDGRPIGNPVGGQSQPEALNTVLNTNVPDLRAAAADAKRCTAQAVIDPVAVDPSTVLADPAGPHGTTFGLWTETWQR